jgi:hypothetical protein
MAVVPLPPDRHMWLDGAMPMRAEPIEGYVLLGHCMPLQERWLAG